MLFAADLHYTLKQLDWLVAGSQSDSSGFLIVDSLGLTRFAG